MPFAFYICKVLRMFMDEDFETDLLLLDVNGRSG